MCVCTYVCVYVCEGACADKFCFDELFQCRRLLRVIFTQNFVFFSNIFLQSFKLIFHHCYLLLLFFNVFLVVDCLFLLLFHF